MKIANKIILFVLSLSVLVSYYIVFTKLYKSKGTSYFKHDFWFGLNEPLVKFLTFFQICAAVGFVIANIYWLKEEPVGGIMGNSNVRFVTLALFFIFSAIWTFSVYYKKHFLTVFSLVIVAISSILLLAGSIEEKNPRMPVIIGFFYLCVVTVLADGVIWNANYISKITKK